MSFLTLFTSSLFGGCQTSNRPSPDLSAAGSNNNRDSDSGVSSTPDTTSAPIISVNALTEADKKIFSRLGFHDDNNDGYYAAEERSSRAFDENAFQCLAQIAGDVTVVDGNDLYELRMDPEKLAKLIREDTYYQDEVVKGTSLVSSQYEETSARLCAYAQMAYVWHIPQTGFLEDKIDGQHGPATTQATKKLQEITGITRTAKCHKIGEAMGRNVMGGILLMLEHPADELIIGLSALTVSGVLNVQRVQPVSQELLAASLRYLYPDEIPLNGNPSESQIIQNNMTAILSTHYEGPMLTQKKIDKIIAGLQKKFPETTKHTAQK